jgi:methylated-DNA-[protein]-cysteine S-methyltransferase
LSPNGGRLAGVLTWTTLASPVDELLLTANDGALRSVWFSPHKTRPHPSMVEQLGTLGAIRDDHDPVLVETARQLGAYFAGRLTEFDLPMDPVGTPFQQLVWGALCTIPYGETWSYGELAAAVGKGPAASRAVGLANGANPISIFVPCHRVIGADGSLVGYGGGLDRKRFLLELEQPSLFS